MTKRVAIYLADINHFHGIGEVERCIALGVAKRAKEIEKSKGIRFTFIVPKTEVGKYGSQVDYMVINNWIKLLVNLDFTGIARKLLLPHFDLLHLTHQTPKWHRTIADSTLVTIHDVNFFHNNNCSASSMERKKKRIERILGIATHLSFVSNFSYQDVKEHFTIKQPCRVVANGTQDWSEVKRTSIKGLPDNYFFHISDVGEKKNVHLLADMMRFLPNENLVIAGGSNPANRKRITDIIEKYNLRNILLLGRVSDEEKAYLLSECKAFLFPSRSEGFGLPVLEAMCLGKPVVISNLTSLPEVGGDIAYYYDDLSPESMAAKTTDSIVDFYSNEKENSEASHKHALSFSWDKAVEEYIDYYYSILGRK